MENESKNITHQEIVELISRGNNGKATDQEWDTYMRYLVDKEKITRQQYEDYSSGKQRDHLRQLALIAGIGILGMWLINNLAKK